MLEAEATMSAPALRLRPWRAADAPALVAAHRDPLLRRWLSTCVTDEAEARLWVDRQILNWVTGVRFGFAVLEGDLLAGHVVLKTGSAHAEVGYWTSADVRGRGVAPRAVEAVSRWAFRTRGVARLDLLHAVDNHASCRVADKCGFALKSLLPARPPGYPEDGHLHVRTAEGA